MFFQGSDICENGCVYESFNSTSKQIKCSCNNKDKLIFSERNKTKKVPFKLTSNYNNIKLVECYHLLIN